MAEFSSEIVTLSGSAEQVYNRLSNPEALGALLSRMREKAEGASGNVMPENIAQNLDKISLSGDSIMIQGGPTGSITLVLGDRQPYSLIEYNTQNSPLPIAIVFHLEEAENLSRLKVSINAQIPVFLKGMVAKPLQQAVDMFATLMEKIPSWE